jgi:hypothetical protein
MTAGFRWSNWAAAELAEGETVGFPDVPTTMGRPVF